MEKPICTKCKGTESPNSVEQLNDQYWQCHECMTVFKVAKLGRPSVGGKSRGVKLTLPAEDWKHIDSLVVSGRVSSVAEYFRDLHNSSLTKFLKV